MPNHLHFLAEGLHPTADALRFVGSFKQQTSYLFSQRTHQRLWQSKWYDHLLRSTDSHENISWYICQNPVRKGLCQFPSNYPYLGSFSECGSKLLQSSPATSTWTHPGSSAALSGRHLGVSLGFLFAFQSNSHRTSSPPKNKTGRPKGRPVSPRFRGSDLEGELRRQLHNAR